LKKHTHFTQKSLHNHKMSHGVILRVCSTVVEKMRFREDCLTLNKQKTIHRLIEHILSTDTYQFLSVPELLDDPQTDRYRMSRIRTNRPLYLGIEANNSIIYEIKLLWTELWSLGYAAWDFELYIQPDGTVMMIDFDRFGTRMYGQQQQQHHIPLQENIHLPITIPPGTFFDNVCFPVDFQTRLNL
jgi:hypothetical protein